MRKPFIFFITFCLLFNCLFVTAYGVNYPSVSAHSAIVMIAATGEVLYEKNAYEQRGIASTTKILTCITALENAPLNAVVKANTEDVTVEGTSIGLKAGDEIDLLTLIKGMLLESGNDAANTTAHLVCGNKDDFCRLMNKKASEIGMKSSLFQNPSGLTQKGHYSCAYDMALLGSYAIKNRLFKSICASSKLSVSFGTPKIDVTFYNHNKLLNKYEGAFGIKTGFTKASGRCLVSAVEKNGVVLVAVTLNAYDDWNDHIKLYDYCFELVKSENADINISNISIPIVNSSVSEVSLKTSKNVFIPYVNKKPCYKVCYYLPHFEYGGIKKGDYLGWLEVKTDKGILIDKVYLLSRDDAPTNSVKTKEKGFKERLLNLFEKDRR